MRRGYAVNLYAGSRTSVWKIASGPTPRQAFRALLRRQRVCPFLCHGPDLQVKSLAVERVPFYWACHELGARVG